MKPTHHPRPRLRFRDNADLIYGSVISLTIAAASAALVCLLP
jgi:hypothetical protein